MAAKLALGILQSGHELVGVFRADKLRHGFFESQFRDLFFSDDFYSIIKKYKIPEINTKSINDKKFVEHVKKLSADVILVGSCGEILKKELITCAKVACVNVHPSLLPKYRGPNPYFYTIKNGESDSGVTFHLISEKVDGGSILMQKKVPISDFDTGQTLRIRTTHQASLMVKELLDALESNIIIPLAQDEKACSYYPALSFEDVLIDWTKSSKEIRNLIRASYPWCCCYTNFKNHLLEIKECKSVTYEGIVLEPGTVLNNDERGLVVATGEKNKAILLTDIKFFGLFSNLWSKRSLKKIKIQERLGL